MYRMDESQNPTKFETDTSERNERKDEIILTSKSATASSSTSSPVIGIRDNLVEKIQKIEMKGNSSKKLATSNITIGDSNLLETGVTRVNQIKASASNQLLTNQPSNVTSSGSATVAEKEQAMSIDVLSDDCLVIIFCHLSIVDRVKIERVSKRWNDLSKSSWSHVKKLDLDSPSWGFRPRGFLSDQQKTINIKEFKEILKRCGKYLETIDATEIYSPYHHLQKVISRESLVIASCIASYCPDIKSLTIMLSGVKTLKKLVDSCKNIVELCIIAVGIDIEEIEFSDFLSNYKNLRILKLSLSIISIDGSFLLNLSLLETLDLDSFVVITEIQHLENAVKKMNNLKVFKVSLKDSQLNDVIVALQNCSNLEILYLHNTERRYPDLENQLGLLFKNNQKLETLSLRFFKLTGKCLIYLNPKCFKDLRFSFCRNLKFAFLNNYLKNFNQLCKFEYAHTDTSVDIYEELMKFISSLENLKFLKLEFREKNLSLSENFNLLSALINLEELILVIMSGNINDCLKLVGKNFKNLKIFKLKNCVHVSDIAINVSDVGINAITSLPKLEDLSFYCIKNITGKGWSKMKNLKKLTIDSCENIEFDCLKKILAESEKLEYLHVSDCKKINKIDLILFANEMSKKRTNDIILYIDREFFDSLDRKLFSSKKLKKVKKSPYLEYKM